MEYNVLTFVEAQKLGAPAPDWMSPEEWEEDIDYYDVHCNGIWQFSNGVPVKYIGRDGGEPEDQTLFRGWSWVAQALNDAWNEGRKSLND